MEVLCWLLPVVVFAFAITRYSASGDPHAINGEYSRGCKGDYKPASCSFRFECKDLEHIKTRTFKLTTVNSFSSE